jgi:hypothetical protein
MFDTIPAFSLASALAASGTLTVAYPSGRSKGNYSLSGGRHVLIVRGSTTYYAPDDFTLTFNANASSITLTWGAGKPTLAAGTTVTLQIERAGQDDGRPNDPANPAKMVDARHWLIDLGSPNILDADGIAASQSVAAGASFLLNGALLSGTSMILDVPRNVVAAWTTTSVLTITGKDEYGNVMVEKSASGTSHTGKKAFKEITSVSSTAAITSATVGTGDVLGLPVFVGDAALIKGEMLDGALVSGFGNSKIVLTSRFADISTAESIWFSSPVAGKITKISTILHGAITVADANITTEINTVAVTGSAFVVATSGSAAGVVDSAVPTAANTVAVGDAIEVITDGGSTTAAIATVLVEITPDLTLIGTFVAGVDATAQSFTAGDVRGTYDPLEACNGDRGYKLLVALPDPAFKGNDQFVS